MPAVQGAVDAMVSYDLVILDFYDTIVQLEGEAWLPRRGIGELLLALQRSGKRLAVCSDAGEDRIQERLGSLVEYFAHIYGHSTLVHEDETYYKDLGRICEEQGVPKERAIFLGDNYVGTDERSAKRYGIEYIRVPNAREDRDYDFLQLAGMLLG